MELITKNKVVAYIQQYPEAQTALLIWFKEFKYNQGARLARRDGTRSATGLITGEARLGRGDHHIRYRANPWLKTAYIIWFGTGEELQAYRLNEIEKYKAANPGAIIRQKTITHKVVAYPPSDEELLRKKPTTAAEINLTDFPVIDIDDDSSLVPDDSYVPLNTTEGYEQALNRAITIFGSKPGSPEFDELALLLPAIKMYERGNIVLPQLSVTTFIKQRMEERGLTPLDLAWITGIDEATVTLMLEDKQPISAKTQAALFKYWQMPYLINHLSFFA